MLDTRRRLLLAAAACVAAFLVLLAIVYTTERGAAYDERALAGFGDLRRPRLVELADAVSSGADPKPFAIFSLVLVAIAFIRGYPWLGVAVGVLLLGANVTSQILKPVLANPRGSFGEYGVAAEAFPSGHATAAMSLALAAVLVAPAWVRPVAATLGTAFAIAVGLAIMSLDWHFPSDVAGGYLVATAWCFGVLAALRTGRLKAAALPAREEPYAWWLAAVIMLVPLGLVGWLALDRLPRITGYAEGHTTFAVVTAATAALAALLVAAVLAVPNRR